MLNGFKTFCQTIASIVNISFSLSIHNLGLHCNFRTVCKGYEHETSTYCLPYSPITNTKRLWNQKYLFRRSGNVNLKVSNGLIYHEVWISLGGSVINVNGLTILAEGGAKQAGTTIVLLSTLLTCLVWTIWKYEYFVGIRIKESLKFLVLFGNRFLF